MDIEDTILEPTEPRTIGSVHSRYIKKKKLDKVEEAIGDNIPGKSYTLVIHK